MAKKLTLTEIIDRLEATEDVDKITDAHEDAREKYKPSAGIIKRKTKDFRKFKAAIADYLKHHHKSLYKTELPDHMATAMVEELLANYKGAQKGGHMDAFGDAKKGKLADVLDYIKVQLREDELGKRDVHIIESSVDPFDLDHQTAIVKDYMETHEHLLTPGMKATLNRRKKPEQLAQLYKGLLGNHRQAAKDYKGLTQQAEQGERE